MFESLKSTKLFKGIVMGSIRFFKGVAIGLLVTQRFSNSASCKVETWF